MPGWSASEIEAELAARYRDDPAYRAEVDERREQQQARSLERKRKLAPFKADLSRAGVTETYDRMTGRGYADERIFDVAFLHLSQRGGDDETRAWIARSFETRGAAPHWDRLAAMYLAAEGPQEREALAAALCTSARSTNVEQMKQFVQTPELGSSRIFFLRPINRLDRKGGRDFVLTLLGDPELGPEADRVRRRVSRNS
ncbi:hypothetical protein GCM10022200_11620 [Microbacterium awajiense]|uniref:Uncharacterized protein n=1 Tax=Microbacterium awajiense TaxID=415214 RepID=A0ABP7AEJ4_9MICO